MTRRLLWVASLLLGLAPAGVCAGVWLAVSAGWGVCAGSVGYAAVAVFTRKDAFGNPVLELTVTDCGGRI